jgi:formamidopyrimidine-DNA glycosylase
LLGAGIIACDRRGKLLMLHLDNGFTILAHLRMTGQLIFRDTANKTGMRACAARANGSPTEPHSDDPDFGGGYPSRSLIGELPDRSTRAIISFADGSHLYFNDQRKFGYLKLVSTALLAEDDFLRRLGLEPLAANFDWRALRERLPMHSKRPIKALLLDQEIVAGIGNIYADESLFLAGIHPERTPSSLTVPAIKRLHAGIQDCLRQSIADGGSTARDYVDAEGLRGEYLDRHAQVYGRAGQPCPKCGRPISKIRIAGRGTHFCRHCQK